MSFQLMAWAVEQRTGSPVRKAVLLHLANCANHQTGDCHPSVEHLADETELGPRTVRRALKELEAAGYIGRERERLADGTLGGYTYTFPHHRPERPPAARAAGGTSGQNQRPERPVNNQELEPGTSTNANAFGAQKLVGHFVDRARERNVLVLDKVKSTLGREVKKLLAEGATEEQIEAGIDRMIDRGIASPHLLANLVMEATMPKPKSRQQSLLDFIQQDDQ